MVQHIQPYQSYLEFFQSTYYSFLEVGVRQVFKGGNYSREETIVFLLFESTYLFKKY